MTLQSSRMKKIKKGISHIFYGIQSKSTPNRINSSDAMGQANDFLSQSSKNRITRSPSCHTIGKKKRRVPRTLSSCAEMSQSGSVPLPPPMTTPKEDSVFQMTPPSYSASVVGSFESSCITETSSSSKSPSFTPSSSPTSQPWVTVRTNRSNSRPLSILPMSRMSRQVSVTSPDKSRTNSPRNQTQLLDTLNRIDKMFGSTTTTTTNSTINSTPLPSISINEIDDNSLNRSSDFDQTLFDIISSMGVSPSEPSLPQDLSSTPSHDEILQYLHVIENFLNQKPSHHPSLSQSQQHHHHHHQHHHHLTSSVNIPHSQSNNISNNNNNNNSQHILYHNHSTSSSSLSSLSSLSNSTASLMSNTSGILPTPPRKTFFIANKSNLLQSGTFGDSGSNSMIQ